MACVFYTKLTVPTKSKTKKKGLPSQPCLSPRLSLSPSLSLPRLYLSPGDVSSSKHTLYTDGDLICRACYKGDLEGRFD